MSSFTKAQWFEDLKQRIDADNNLYWHASNAIISIFDDVRFDRSDIDFLSPSMRKYIVKKLKELHCKQVRGNQLISPHGVSLWMPKPSILGASSFDITRYQKRKDDDIYILTPTQTAAYSLINTPIEQAVEDIVSMMQQQPINLRKLEDHIRQSHKHEKSLQAMPYLRYRLRKAQEQVKLKHKRHIGSVF